MVWLRCNVSDEEYASRLEQLEQALEGQCIERKIYLINDFLISISKPSNNSNPFLRLDASGYQQRSPSLFIWMTVNFRPDLSLQDIRELLNRIASRKFMTQYWYSIEQRSEIPGIYTGIHSHWIIITNHPKSQFKRDILSTLGKGIGNPLHVDVRYYPAKFLKEKLDYLKGSKWDADKWSKVQNDRIFRKENNLAEVYTNGTDSYGSCKPLSRVETSESKSEDILTEG